MKIKFIQWLCTLSSLFWLTSEAQNIDFEWASQGGGVDFDYATAEIIDHNQNVVSVGEFEGSFTVLNEFISSNGDGDVYIRKLDPLGNILWYKHFGGVNNDFPVDVEVDKNNNIYVYGQFSGTVDFDPGVGVENLNSSSGAQFVLKLDENGTFIWAKQVDCTIWGTGSMSMNLGELEVTRDGGVCIGSTFYNCVDFDPSLDTNILCPSIMYAGSIFILKLDMNGNFQWVRQYDVGSGLYTYGRGICFKLDKDDNLYMSATLSDSIDLDASSGTHVLTLPTGTNGIFVCKLTSEGDVVWGKVFESSSFLNLPEELVIDGEHNVYVSGIIRDGSVSIDPNPGGMQFDAELSNTGFILKLNEYGDFEWVNKLESIVSTNNSIRSVQLEVDYCGFPYLAATYRDTFNYITLTDTTTIYSDSIRNIALFKLYNDGALNWITTFNGTGEMFPSNIHVDDSSNIYMNGYFSDSCSLDFDSVYEMNTSTSLDDFNYYLAKFSQCSMCIRDEHQVCDSLLWIDGNVYTESNHTAQYIDTNSLGCDSIIVLDLTVGYEEIFIDNQTICDDSYTWLDGNIYVSNNNTATYLLQSIEGCDSLVQLNLVFNDMYITTDVQYACDSLLWIDGQTYYDNEYYATQMFVSQDGCDSLVRLNLEITSLDMSVNETNSGLTAVYSSIDAQYQWLDCNNGYSILSGETTPTLNGVLPGEYAVQITSNGCTDTSACYTVQEPVGVDEYNWSSDIRIYNNVDSRRVTVKTLTSELISVHVYNILGQSIYSFSNVNQNVLEFALPELTGIYLVEVQAHHAKKQLKVFNP